MDSEEKKKDEEDNIIHEIETSGSGNKFKKKKSKMKTPFQLSIDQD